MPTLLIRNPDGTEQTQVLSDEVTIGRADGNALVLAEGGVSRRHARFFLEGDQVMVEDLGSANGTWVDGERIEGPTAVGPRSQVVIGDYELSLKPAAKRPSGPKVGGAAAAPPARKAGTTGDEATSAVPAVRAARSTRQLPSVPKRPAGAAGAKGAGAGAGGAALARRPAGAAGAGAGGAALARRPAGAAGAAGASAGAVAPMGPSLRGITGPWANKVYPLRGKVVVGRVAGSQIQLEDESVSRRHAELETTTEGIVLRDLQSANGTTVNGEPVEDELVLQPGDIVSFGMIELAYEEGDIEVLKAPTRRGTGARAAAAPARRGAGPAADDGAAKRKKLLIVAGAAVGVLLMAGVVVKAMGGGGGGGGGEAVAATGPVAPIDPSAQVEQLLSECRSYSATDQGTQPNWQKAKEICEKARDLDPINSQVLAQIQRITLEQECQKHFDKGNTLMNRLREEEALEEFGKIDKECSYYRIVKPKARDAIAAVKKRAKEDCANYAKSGFWENALDRCEKYMTIACQDMSEDSLRPPPGYEIDLVGRKGRHSWRPKDPMYLNLLRAREKKDPAMGPWICPAMPMFREELVITDPLADVKKVFKARYTEPLMESAMELYWQGKTGEATVKLMRVRENREKAAFHVEADDLRADMSAVENLYKSGSTLLQSSDFDKAADAFRDALKLDEKLMKELAKTKPSFYRSAIQADMAKATYQGGKFKADREDVRGACKIWKLGFGFYRGNPDLNRAVGFCSNQGANRLANASGCGDLDAVLDFAVEGDGLDKKVEDQRAQLHCSAE